MPTPNSSSSAAKPCREGALSGNDRRPGCDSRRSRTGAAAARSTSDGEHEAENRAPHHRPRDPGPQPSLAAGGVDHPADDRDAERVHAIAQEPEQRRHERERGEDRDQPDGERADAEAAQDRVGNEQEPRHREHERQPAEEDGAIGGRSGAGDRVELVATGRALLAVARDDEEAVVGGDREPHHRRHLEQEHREVEPLAEDRGEPERDPDREEGDDAAARSPRRACRRRARG